jgi:hypothetical protein
MKQDNVLPIVIILFGIWITIVMDAYFERKYMQFHFANIYEKLNHITLMISGEYEPIDLTYLPRITKKEGLKEKE